MPICPVPDTGAGVPPPVDPADNRTACEMVPIIERAIQSLVASGGHGHITSISYQGRSTSFGEPMSLIQLRRLKEHYAAECAAAGGPQPLTGPLSRRPRGRVRCLGPL